MRRKDEDADAKAFGRAIDQVKPMAGRDRTIVPRGKPAAGPRSAEAPVDPFVYPDPGQPRLGQRRSEAAGTAESLQTRSPKPDQRLDLHGSRAEHAEEATRRAIDQCVRSGGSVLLVIHGRGKHTGGVSVLREELPGWLEAHPRVVAYAPARGSEGGEGATLVRLRGQ